MCNSLLVIIIIVMVIVIIVMCNGRQGFKPGSSVTGSAGGADGLLYDNDDNDIGVGIGDDDNNEIGDGSDDD